jgi:pimeloyl-ACP methyl ester carboxylesterase
MSVKTLIALFATVAASFAAPTIVQADQEKATMETAIPKPTKTGHAAVNGVNYYYAVYGKGEPLLLLHGGLGQIEMFGPNLARLAQTRQVIGVDLHGHGRTALGTRQISLDDMGNDMAGVLKKLGYDKVDVLGYSMGGGVGFQFAIQHPQMIRRLVLVSAGYARDAFYPEMLPMQAAVGAGMAEQMKGTPMYESYVAIAPKATRPPSGWPSAGPAPRCRTRSRSPSRDGRSWHEPTRAVRARRRKASGHEEVPWSRPPGRHFPSGAPASGTPRDPRRRPGPVSEALAGAELAEQEQHDEHDDDEDDDGLHGPPSRGWMCVRRTPGAPRRT